MLYSTRWRKNPPWVRKFQNKNSAAASSAPPLNAFTQVRGMRINVTTKTAAGAPNAVCLVKPAKTKNSTAIYSKAGRDNAARPSATPTNPRLTSSISTRASAEYSITGGTVTISAPASSAVSKPFRSDTAYPAHVAARPPVATAQTSVAQIETARLPPEIAMRAIAPAR